MERNLDQDRRQAHALLDALPAKPETAAALDRARKSLARGEGIPHEDILRQLSLAGRMR